jgi:hypothetical protein
MYGRAYYQYVNGSRGWARGRVTAAPCLVALAIVAVVAAGFVTSGSDRDTSSGRVGAAASELTTPPATYRVGGPSRHRTVLHYRGGLDGRLVADSSGGRNPGQVMSGRGGDVVSTRSRAASGKGGRDGGRDDSRIAARDRYLRFTGRQCLRPSRCPWSVVLPRRDLALDDADTAAFAFGAWVRLRSAPGGRGMTVIHRGSGPDGDAQWSLRVDDGRVSCRWSDGTHAAVLPDDLGRSVPLDVDRWYALSCARQGSRFSLAVVDPVTTWPIATHTRVDPEVGVIRAHGPTTIGATALTGRADSVTAKFSGDLDEIMVRAG